MSFNPYQVACSAFNVPTYFRPTLHRDQTTLSSYFSSNVSGDWVSEEFLDTEIVITLNGNNSLGYPFWVYVLMMGENLALMFEKIKYGKGFTASDYGLIVASGSDRPTEWLKDVMRQEYNMEDIPLPES